MSSCGDRHRALLGAAIAFAAVVVAFAVTAGIANNTIFGALSVPSLAALMEETPGVLQQASLVLLAGLFLRSFVRRGLRSFVGELREGFGLGARLRRSRPTRTLRFPSGVSTRSKARSPLPSGRTSVSNWSVPTRVKPPGSRRTE